MADFQIVVAGDGADSAANELTAILADGEAPTAISRSVNSSPSDPTSKSVDPLALVTVVLGIPVTVLAVTDIADRIRKRGKAEKLIAAAKRLRSEKHVTITVTAPDGATWTLDRLEADTMLEIADGSKPAS